MGETTITPPEVGVQQAEVPGSVDRLTRLDPLLRKQLRGTLQALAQVSTVAVMKASVT